MMETEIDHQQKYEKQFVLNLLMYRKAIQQYQWWGRRAVRSDTIRDHPQFHDSIRELIQCVKACADGLMTLPEPPQNVQEADQLIRKVGQDFLTLSHCLEELAEGKDKDQHGSLSYRVEQQIQAIQQVCNHCVAMYDQIYPNRLSLLKQQLEEEMAL